MPGVCEEMKKMCVKCERDFEMDPLELKGGAEFGDKVRDSYVCKECLGDGEER